MKLIDIAESRVSYTKLPTVRFRVKGPTTFTDLKTHPDLVKRMGPNTVVFDVTTEERVAKAPGENKWNAMCTLYGHDEDEVVCAQAFPGEWICLAVNVEV